MTRRVLLGALAALATVPAAALADDPTKKTIVCVGDSITFGAHSSNIGVYGWPEQLQHMLGKFNRTEWTAMNLGLCGRYTSAMRTKSSSSP